ENTWCTVVPLERMKILLQVICCIRKRKFSEMTNSWVPYKGQITVYRPATLQVVCGYVVASGQLIWGSVNGDETTNICGVTAAKTYLIGPNAGLFWARFQGCVMMRLLMTADDGIHKISKAFETYVYMMGTPHKNTIRYHIERGLDLDSLQFVGVSL
ncbi:LOW QUALITY PROTEIN: hypothetical protein M8C21_021776, partial [Ambrosia artemisiifolia]